MKDSTQLEFQKQSVQIYYVNTSRIGSKIFKEYK